MDTQASLDKQQSAAPLPSSDSENAAGLSPTEDLDKAHYDSEVDSTDSLHDELGLDTECSPELLAEERKLVRKLDLYFLPWACVSQIMKKVDQNNYKAAYTAGMRDDLGLAGTNALNMLDIYFTIPFVVFTIPSMLLVTRIRPSYFLPTLELGWGVLTALMACATRVEQMYPIRFFIGAMEASCWALITTLLLSWYTPREMAKRQSIFLGASFVGGMFTFAMQSAIHQTLEGQSGMRGWRWLFVINGIMTIVVAVIGYFAIPDYPRVSRACYLTERQRKIAYQRLLRYGKRTLESMNEYTGLQGFKTLILKLVRTAIGWKFILLFLCYGPWVWATQVNSWFNLFLDSLTNADGSKMFSVKQVTEIPIAGSGLALVSALAMGYVSDRFQKRWQIAASLDLVLLFCAIVLSVWPDVLGLIFFTFMLSYTVFANEAIFMSWIGEICKSDPVERMLAVALAFSLTMAGNVALPLFLWPAKEAPRYKYGYKFACGFAALSLVSTLVYKFAQERENRQKTSQQEAQGDSGSQSA